MKKGATSSTSAAETARERGIEVHESMSELPELLCRIYGRLARGWFQVRAVGEKKGDG